jgi:hypothetical protein
MPGEKLASIVVTMLGIAMVAVVLQSPNTSKVINAGGTAFIGSVRAVMGK